MDLINICPVKSETGVSIFLSRAMVKSLRGLRRGLRLCPACSHRQSCPFLLRFHNQVQIAIQEVVQEWVKQVDPEAGRE